MRYLCLIYENEKSTQRRIAQMSLTGPFVGTSEILPGSCRKEAERSIRIASQTPAARPGGRPTLGRVSFTMTW